MDSFDFDFFACLDAVLPLVQALFKNRDTEEMNATINPYHCVPNLAAVFSEDCTENRQQNQL